MTAEKLHATLRRLGACAEARKWAEGKTLAEAWAACERGDWMLWLAGVVSGEPGSDSRRKLVLCACECARLALPHVKAGDDRPAKAIETAEKWARGEGGVTLGDVRKAATTAAAAATTAATAAAVAAVAAYAATAATAYAAAAAVAAADDAKKETLLQCAEIARRPCYYHEPPDLTGAQS